MIRNVNYNGEIDAIRIITPPSFITLDNSRTSVFLAGSIEMDKAEQWQQRFIDEFISQYERGSSGRFVDIFNPRRANWDITAKQSIEDPVFYQQVRWELDYLEDAKVRVFYFAPDTLSPISLLEFGKFFDYPNTFLCVNSAYQRAGNLEVFANKYKIKIHRDFGDIIRKIKWL